MKSFFTSDSLERPFKILEIGCGSGWVGRLVADENCHVTGTDFSKGQLEIAKTQALLFDKEKFCKYELADASTFEKDVHGVIIHALLHHLTVKELDTFFKHLSNIASGTKVFIYEPVFINRSERMPSLRDKFLYRLTNLIKSLTIALARGIGSVDKELSYAMEKIMWEAKENGWYISPKEVPFYENELIGYLNKDFEIGKQYVVNKSDLEISQALILNNIRRPGIVFSKILIPLLAGLDRLSFKGNYTFYLAPQTHEFICFELIRK